MFKKNIPHSFLQKGKLSFFSHDFLKFFSTDFFLLEKYLETKCKIKLHIYYQTGYWITGNIVRLDHNLAQPSKKQVYVSYYLLKHIFDRLLNDFQLFKKCKYMYYFLLDYFTQVRYTNISR